MANPIFPDCISVIDIHVTSRTITHISPYNIQHISIQNHTTLYKYESAYNCFLKTLEIHMWPKFWWKQRRSTLFSQVFRSLNISKSHIYIMYFDLVYILKQTHACSFSSKFHLRNIFAWFKQTPLRHTYVVFFPLAIDVVLSTWQA